MPGTGLCDGLDGWRRHIARRRSAAAARRWSLITLGAALAGVAAGRIDGSTLVVAVAAAALPLAAGAVSVVRARRVCAADAAGHLDAAFGFDEQVATALYFTEAGTAAGGRMTVHDRLVADLIERATGLVARAGVVPGHKPVPAYGEWAAMAVTAAAIAAAATVPGSPPVKSDAAVGGPARTSTPAGAVLAPRPAQASGVMPGSSASPDGRVTSRHEPARTASAVPTGGTRPAGGTQPAASPAGGPNTPATGGASAAPGKAGARGAPGKAGTRTAPRNAGTQAAPGNAGARAAGGRSVAAPAGGLAQRGLARPVTGQEPTTRAAPGGAPSTRAAARQRNATRSAAARHAAVAPGSAAHGGGRPGGTAAGKEPGNSPASARRVQPLPNSGDAVLLIVLPGGVGVIAAPDGHGAPGQQPEGNGGAAAVRTATTQGNGAEYVPPDQNEVPFPDQGVLGRYF